MRNKWTEEEKQIIYDNYNNLSDIELSELIPRHSFLSIVTERKKLGCHKTNKKYTYEDVVNTCNECGYILLSTEFVSCANNIDFICEKHQDKGIQHVTYGHMLEGKGCYWCGRKKTEQARRDMISIEKRIQICEKNGLKYVGSNYNDKLLNIEFICLKHPEMGVQTMRYANMKRGIVGCRYCAKEKGIVKSKGELETIDALNNLGINFVEQKIYSDCKDISYLPFDFYLVDYNILIEFDGEQHYFPVRFNGMSQQDAEDNFINIKHHDEMKTQFCCDYNIPLIRIPYFERGNVLFYLQEQLSLLNIKN